MVETGKVVLIDEFFHLLRIIWICGVLTCGEHIHQLVRIAYLRGIWESQGSILVGDMDDIRGIIFDASPQRVIHAEWGVAVQPIAVEVLLIV